MLRDEVLDIANDMEFMSSIWIDDHGNAVNDLVKFAEMVAAKEREACAKLSETFFDPMWAEHDQAAKIITNAIRARNEA